jgi:AcrR family transcriptional regulator
VRRKLPKITDPRVQRTDERLRSAFISLVHERGFAALKIGDVVQRAGVGRSTFYAHFGDLDALHESWLQGFAAHCRGNRPLLDFVHSFIRHAHPQRGSWHGMGGNSRGAAMRRRLRRKLVALAKDELAQRASHERPALLEATCEYLAGGIADVLFWWIDSTNKLSPQELEAWVEQLTARALGPNGVHGKT